MTQETFLRAYLGLPGFSGGNLKAWLLRSAFISGVAYTVQVNDVTETHIAQ